MAGKNQLPYKTEKYWFLNNQWKENFLKPFLPRNENRYRVTLSEKLCVRNNQKHYTVGPPLKTKKLLNVFTHSIFPFGFLHTYTYSPIGMAGCSQLKVRKRLKRNPNLCCVVWARILFNKTRNTYFSPKRYYEETVTIASGTVLSMSNT